MAVTSKANKTMFTDIIFFIQSTIVKRAQISMPPIQLVVEK